jgi:hypothetical protein
MLNTQGKFSINVEGLEEQDCPKPTGDSIGWSRFATPDRTITAKFFVRDAAEETTLFLADRAAADVVATIEKPGGEIEIFHQGRTIPDGCDDGVFLEVRHTANDMTTTHLCVIAVLGTTIAVLRVVFLTALTPRVRNQAVAIARSMVVNLDTESVNR